MKKSTSGLDFYNTNNFTIKNWKSLDQLFWIINPLFALNEILSGEVRPKVTLIEKNSSKPYAERVLIPCPECGTLHNRFKWSKENSLKYENWFGYYCDNCGDIIKPQRNLFTKILMTLTFPVWFHLQNKLKDTWLKKQPERYKNLDLQLTNKTINTTFWLKYGLSHGFTVFFLMQLFLSYFLPHSKAMQLSLASFPFWMIMGVVWSYYMAKRMRERAV
jgi:predicted RNA-binding Zn-ribbon protein involved in translation (DUF1610 family)